MGDPGGIGPEVLVKALADGELAARASLRVLGLGSVLRHAASAAGIEPFWRDAVTGDGPGVTLIDYEREAGVQGPFPAANNAVAGRWSLRFVEEAIALATLPPSDPRRVAGVVTGPISKAAWAMAGETRYLGHTELFAERLGAARHAMMFVSPVLNVVLATAHIPLRRVTEELTTERVLTAITLGAATLRGMGVASPRVAVCGVNPHAGEEGLLGDEDARIVAPAILAARAAGIDAVGPLPGDTAWSAAVRRPGREPKFDLVVAMYHDQGLAPLKLLARDEAVNMTVGLPIVRTSPDHGTAFDIAGRNLADPGSTRSAIGVAIRVCSGADGSAR